MLRFLSSQLKSKSVTTVLIFVVSLIVLHIGLHFKLNNDLWMAESRVARAQAIYNSEEKPSPFTPEVSPQQKTTLMFSPQPQFTSEMPPKVKNCSFDFNRYKAIIDEIQVLPMTNHNNNNSLLSVLCYIMCNSAYHERAEVIKKTWGSHCDGFFIASNLTDMALGSVAVSVPHDHTYEYLWQKQRATIRYLYQNNIAQKYDWLLKADTDTYVIIENLKSYLAEMDMSMPQLIGGRVVLPHKVRDELGLVPMYDGYFKNVQQKQDRWMYAQGGAYVMNQMFLNNMLTVLDTEKCLANETNRESLGVVNPEDMATAFCVASTYPLSITRNFDEHGRGLFHLYPPRIRSKESYSRHSINFHHFKKNWRETMYWMENQLYFCREQKRT